MRKLVLAAGGVLTPAGCSDMRVDGFAGATPTFKSKKYVQGHTKVWGLFRDRFGTIKRQFVVEIDGTMDNGTLVKNESVA